MSFVNCKILIPTGADAEQYHANATGLPIGNPERFVTSGFLREFANCPARVKAGYVPPDSEAKDWGSLLDCLYLTPETFDTKYALRPENYKSDKGEVKPWNNNATVCKEWNEAAEADGRKPLKKSDLAEIQSAIARLTGDSILESFRACSDRQVWVTGFWDDEATGLQIPVQSLVDLAPFKDSEFSSCLGDLKSTRSAKPQVWSRYSSQRQYHVQAAFYLDMWNVATGEARDTFCHVLVENFQPHQPGRSMLSLQKVEFGRILYRAYLARYAQCLKTGVWPDYTSATAIQGWNLDEANRFDEAEAMAALDVTTPKPDPEELPEEIESLN